jgi:hypothetical protein
MWFWGDISSSQNLLKIKIVVPPLFYLLPAISSVKASCLYFKAIAKTAHFSLKNFNNISLSSKGYFTPCKS